MITLRASSVGRFLACQASQTKPSILIGTSSGPSELGTAAHELLEAVVNGREYDIRAAAHITDTDPEQLSKIVGWCRWRWLTGYPADGLVPLSAFFPMPETEKQFEHVNEDEGLTLTGRLDLHDVVEYDGDLEGRLLDFKTGWLDLPASAQMKAYSFLLFRQYPLIKRVRVWVPKPRHRATDIEVYERDVIDQWYARLIEKVHAEESYNPSPGACRFCPRSHECPGKNALLKQSAEVMDEWKSGAYMRLPDDPEERGQILAQVELRAKFLENYVKVVRETIKSDIEAHGGALGPLLIEEQPRTSIDPGAGLPVLRKAISEDEINACLRLSKTDVEKAVKSTAGRGMKGKIWQQCLSDLEAAEALVPGAIQVVKVDTEKLRPADGPPALEFEEATV